MEDDGEEDRCSSSSKDGFRVLIRKPPVYDLTQSYPLRRYEEYVIIFMEPKIPINLFVY